jgi:hypothetical protein
LLYTQMLREKINDIIADAPDIPAAVARIEAHDGVFFSDHFLVARPLLDAIRGEQPAVLLIDEVDRADEALEAVFLECLGEFQVSVPEIGTYTAKTPPYVVLTSNNPRDLSAALKRRCLHLFLDYPDAERELEIVRSKRTGLPDCAGSWCGGARAKAAAPAQNPTSRDDRLGAHADVLASASSTLALADTASIVLKYKRTCGVPWRRYPRSTRTASCPTPAMPMGMAKVTGTSMVMAGIRGPITGTPTATGTARAQAVLTETAWTARPTAGTSERAWTGRAGTMRGITALRAPVRPAEPCPDRARAAGRSQRSRTDGQADRSWVWKAACTGSYAC